MIVDIVTGLAKFVFLFWELAFSSWRGKPVYTFDRTLGTVGCEVLRVLTALVLVPLFVGVYLYLFNHCAPFSLSSTAVSTWLIAIFVFSFVDYWSHRLSHSVPLLWAIHSVHHQLEELNAVAGGRVSFLNDVVTLGLTFSLALLGIPLSVTLGVVGVAALYSVVLHSPLLGSFGWLRYVVATPAFHRLHHGIQPQYLNKNFSISLSFWDRIFGTHVEETVPPKYGLVNGFASNSPFRANWQPWVDYFTGSRKTYSAPVLKKRSLSQRGYLIGQMALVLFCASLLHKDLAVGIAPMVAGAVLASLAILDALMHQPRRAYYAEGFRVALLMPGVLFLTGKVDSAWWLGGSAVVFLGWLWAAFGSDQARALKDRRLPPADAA